MSDEIYPSGQVLLAPQTFDWEGREIRIGLLAGATFDAADTELDDLGVELLASAELTGRTATITGASDQIRVLDAADVAIPDVVAGSVEAAVIYLADTEELLAWLDAQGTIVQEQAGEIVVIWSEDGVFTSSVGSKARTWTFDTDLEGLADAGLAPIVTAEWDAAGDPAGTGGALSFHMASGGPGTAAERAIKPGPGDSWEDLFAAPAGSTILSVSLASGSRNTKAASGISVVAYTIDLYDDADVSVLSGGTLLTGNAGVSPGWLATPTPSRAVLASKAGSDTAIRLTVTASFTATGASDGRLDLDELRIRIAHAVVRMFSPAFQAYGGPWSATIEIAEPFTASIEFDDGGELVFSEEPRIFRDVLYYHGALKDPAFLDLGLLDVEPNDVSCDVWLPPHSHPVGWVDTLHGGGWAVGDKLQLGGLDGYTALYAGRTGDMRGSFPREFALAGLAAFASNYPLSRYPELTNLYPIPERMNGIRHDWIREHAAEWWHVDPDRGATHGGSAGATEAYLLGSPGPPPYDEVIARPWIKAVIGMSGATYVVWSQDPTPPFDIHEQEIINHWGCTHADDPTCIARLSAGSPAVVADTDHTPPTLVLNSENENVPVQQLTIYDDQLTAKSIEHIAYVNTNTDPDNPDPELAGIGNTQHASYPPTLGFPDFPWGDPVPDGTPMIEVYCEWILHYVTADAPPPPVTVTAPFGILNSQEDAELMLTNTAALGAPYVRIRANVLASPTAWSVLPETVIAAGLDVALVIKSSDVDNGPSQLPGSLAAYKAKIHAAVQRCGSAHLFPIVVIENEPDNASKFWSGTEAEYGTLLQAACEQLHDDGLQVADGGFTAWEFEGLACYEWLVENVSLAAADDFWDRAAPNWVHKADAPAFLAAMQPWADAISATDVDYANLHYYLDSNDPDAIADYATFKAGLFGRPMLSNEAGIRSDVGGVMTNLAQAVADAELPLWVWYSVDTAQGTRCLWVPGTATLRDTGTALRTFVDATY